MPMLRKTETPDQVAARLALDASRLAADADLMARYPALPGGLPAMMMLAKQEHVSLRVLRDDAAGELLLQITPGRGQSWTRPLADEAAVVADLVSRGITVYA